MKLSFFTFIYIQKDLPNIKKSFYLSHKYIWEHVLLLLIVRAIDTYDVTQDGAMLSLSKYAYREIPTLMLKISTNSASNAIVSTISEIYKYQGIFLKWFWKRDKNYLRFEQ